MGKVTVKHFLNKKLKPIYNGYVKESLDTPYYPLYVRITARRQTTEIRSRAFDSDGSSNIFLEDLEDKFFKLFDRALFFEMPSNYFTEDEYEKLENEYYKYLHREKKIITDMVESIVADEKSFFTIKAFNSIYDMQLKLVKAILSEKLKTEICKAISTHEVFYRVTSLYDTQLDFQTIHSIISTITQEKKDCSEFYRYYLEKGKHIILTHQMLKEFPEGNYSSFFEWVKYDLTDHFFNFIDSKIKEEEVVLKMKAIFYDALEDYIPTRLRIK